MHQLLQNLIANALKFRRGDTAPVVTLSAETDTQWMRLSVSDNGIGFDPKYAERIFQMLDTHSEVADEGTAVLAPLRHSLEFRDVSFKYEDASDDYVLRSVSFTVRAGQAGVKPTSDFIAATESLLGEGNVITLGSIRRPMPAQAFAISTQHSAVSQSSDEFEDIPASDEEALVA